jgi:hypothetical protein
MGWLARFFGSNVRVGSTRHVDRAPSSASTALRCSKCGKTSGRSGTPGKIVVGSTAGFLDLVGQCQACRRLVCGACAVKHVEGGITRFTCPSCSGVIGPASG